MFNLFRKKPKQERPAPRQHSNRGLFGYYGLYDWFMTDFNEEDRVRLKTAYGSAGMGLDFERFYTGYESPLMSQGSERGPVDILNTILQKITFNSDNPIDLVEKIIGKMESLITDETDVIEKHFAYMQMKDYYKANMKDSIANEQEFVKYCHNMIAIARQAKEAFEERWKQVPNHSGFFDLLDYYETKRMFEKAKWVDDESLKVWDRSIGINYGSWMDDLLEKRDKVQATQVLHLAQEDEYFDENELEEYREKIAIL